MREYALRMLNMIEYTGIYLKHSPVGTRYCGDIGFLLGFHRDVERLRIETEVTSLCDIFFQHNDVVAIT